HVGTTDADKRRRAFAEFLALFPDPRLLAGPLQRSWEIKWSKVAQAPGLKDLLVVTGLAFGVSHRVGPGLIDDIDDHLAAAVLTHVQQHGRSEEGPVLAAVDRIGGIEITDGRSHRFNAHPLPQQNTDALGKKPLSHRMSFDWVDC